MSLVLVVFFSFVIIVLGYQGSSSWDPHHFFLFLNQMNSRFLKINGWGLTLGDGN